MQTFRRLLFGTAFVFGCLRVGAQNPVQDWHATPLFAPGQMDTMLLQLHALVRIFHPYAYEVAGQTAIDSTLTALRDTVSRRGTSDSLNLQEVFALVRQFRSIMGDGHFQVEYGEEQEEVLAQAAHYYDLATARSDSGAVIVLADLRLADTVAVPLGAEILTLEGMRMVDLLAELTYVGLDDHAALDAGMYVTALNLPYAYQSRYGYRDSLHLSYRLGGQNRDLVLPATRHLLDFEEYGEEKGDIDNYMHLDSTSMPDVLRLHLLSFSRDEYGRGNAKRQLRRIMRYIDRRDTRALIIDVRDNTGGALRLVGELYGYLAQRPYRLLDAARAFHPMVMGTTPTVRNLNRLFHRVVVQEPGYAMPSFVKVQRPKRRRHFDGQVILLTDELTFSGASILAHMVQHYDRGRVVGQAPGGSAERVFAGQFYQGRIGPKGVFTVRVPLWRLDLVGQARGNVLPDVLVARTRIDLIEGRDRTLEVAEDLLRTPVGGVL